MRLDKYLANAGLGSRKTVKQLIRKKHVFVNGEMIIKDDYIIDEYSDEIMVDDEVITYQTLQYYMLNKPAGVISATRDDEHMTVLDLIHEMGSHHCFPVGRLDIDSQGLMIITNDGKLAHHLLSPKHHVDKKYYIECEKDITQDMIEKLCNGSIVLDDENLLPAKYEYISERSGYIIIAQGKFHQVKRMLEVVGNKVLYLKRVAMGPIQLDKNLKLGEYRELTNEEIQLLKELS